MGRGELFVVLPLFSKLCNDLQEEVSKVNKEVIRLQNLVRDSNYLSVVSSQVLCCFIDLGIYPFPLPGTCAYDLQQFQVGERECRMRLILPYPL